MQNNKKSDFQTFLKPLNFLGLRKNMRPLNWIGTPKLKLSRKNALARTIWAFSLRVYFLNMISFYDNVKMINWNWLRFLGLIFDKKKREKAYSNLFYCCAMMSFWKFSYSVVGDVLPKWSEWDVFFILLSKISSSKDNSFFLVLKSIRG